jgi:hypothetical protein
MWDKYTLLNKTLNWPSKYQYYLCETSNSGEFQINFKIIKSASNFKYFIIVRKKSRISSKLFSIY